MVKKAPEVLERCQHGRLPGELCTGCNAIAAAIYDTVYAAPQRMLEERERKHAQYDREYEMVELLRERGIDTVQQLRELLDRVNGKEA